MQLMPLDKTCDQAAMKHNTHDSNPVSDKISSLMLHPWRPLQDLPTRPHLGAAHVLVVGHS